MVVSTNSTRAQNKRGTNGSEIRYRVQVEYTEQTEQVEYLDRTGRVHRIRVGLDQDWNWPGTDPAREAQTQDRVPRLVQIRYRSGADTGQRRRKRV